MSKRLSAPYRSGPSRDWIKVKNPGSPAMQRASDREDPFAAVIRCTADPAKADKRTRSKWTRVMRYATAYKPDSEPLDQFIRRKGGINKCGNSFLSVSGPRCPTLNRRLMTGRVAAELNALIAMAKRLSIVLNAMGQESGWDFISATAKNVPERESALVLSAAGQLLKHRHNQTDPLDQADIENEHGRFRAIAGQSPPGGMSAADAVDGCAGRPAKRWTVEVRHGEEVANCTGPE